MSVTILPKPAWPEGPVIRWFLNNDGDDVLEWRLYDDGRVFRLETCYEGLRVHPCLWVGEMTLNEWLSDGLLIEYTA